jgi:CBS domain-containing membrane protein
MSIKRYLQFSLIDTSNLSVKAKLLAILTGGIAMFMVAFITREFSFNPAYPIIVSSIGASAALLFIVPHSPLAQPWPLIGGQLVSAFVGMAAAKYIPDAAWACAVAVSGSFLAMLLLRCLHPPGASTALAPIMGGAPLIGLGYNFVLMPVAINVAVILIMALILNRFLLKIAYPTLPTKDNAKTDLLKTDIKQALQTMNTFIDVSENDLIQLLTTAQTHRFTRMNSGLHCASIMNKNPLSVSANTSLEKAWRLMLNKQLKALPVIDKSNQLISIITWEDFFKLSPYGNFIKKLSYFTSRLLMIKTNKPKTVADIMATEVISLTEQDSINELIALMSQAGHRQIPIVNQQKRLVGIIYQADVINALYKLHSNS